jgi:4-hydroxy-4-methyl-2-oxoglutarate aldolase
MLEEPPILTIDRGFPRPTAAQLEALAGATTGWIVDAQDGRASLGAAIKPVFPDIAGLDRFVGTAVTCWCGPNDNLAISAALAVAQPGDVIIAATEGFAASAVCGDLLAGMMRNKGIAGLVTDGHVRDLAGLREMGLPVFAAGVTPDSCVRSGPGTVGFPVVIGGRQISSGDLVVADADGVSTIPLARADAVLGRLAEIRRIENEALAAVRGGRTSSPVIDELLASGKVRWAR